MNSSSKKISSKGRSSTVFITILRIWKGSLYKLVWVDLLAYMFFYYAINFVYRFALNFEQKKVFVKCVQFAEEIKQKIPFFFLLGFFVTGVIARWIEMYLLIPWLNRQAFIIEGYVNGNEETKARRLRRTILRYLNLSWILLMRKISDQIAIRFRRNLDTESTCSEEKNLREIFMSFNRDKKIQETYGKIVTDSEIRTFEQIAIQNPETNDEPDYWIPIQWASRVLQKSFLHNYVSDPRTVNKMIEELDRLRGDLHKLEVFCSIMIPLVYTQVVIIAVYSYFVCELLASQLIDPKHNIKGKEVDLYIPIFTIFQFLFLMGWLKVAMCVMNPFGDDDEDFQTSDILDYNLDVTYRSVSGESDMFPESLDPPAVKYECRYKIEAADTLEIFLDHVEYDLEDIYRNDGKNDVSNLELKKSITERISTHLKCTKSTKKKKLESNSPIENELKTIRTSKDNLIFMNTSSRHNVQEDL